MNLPKDVWIHHVLNQVSPICLAHLQATCRVLRQIVSTHETFKTTLDNWKEEKFTGCLADYAEAGHLDLVKLAIAKKGGHRGHQMCAINEAIRNGDFDIFRYLMNTFDQAWSPAMIEEVTRRTECGHFKMIRMFLENDNNMDRHMWLSALRGAICTNNYAALDLFMGRLYENMSRRIDWMTLYGYANDKTMRSYIKNKCASF